MVFGGGQRRLEVLLELRDKFTAQLRSATGETRSFTDALNKARPALLAISGLALGVGGAAIKFASDLEEARGRAVSTFGDAAGVIQQFASDSASAFGLSQRAASDYAAGIGNILQASGLARSASASMSVELVKLAADLAAFNNIPVDEALSKLQAGLTGAERPLRELGILMTDGQVAAAAYRLGIAQAGEELSEGQKVQARYAILLSEGSKAQGSFAENSRSVAAQMQIARAQFEDAAATLGTSLLPATSKALQVLGAMARVVADLPQPVQLAGLALIGVAGALATLGLVLPKIIGGAQTLAKVMNAELLVSLRRVLAPIVAVAAAVLAAKAALDSWSNSITNSFRDEQRSTDIWELMQEDMRGIGRGLDDMLGRLLNVTPAMQGASGATSSFLGNLEDLNVEMVESTDRTNFWTAAWEDFKRKVSGVTEPLIDAFVEVENSLIATSDVIQLTRLDFFGMGEAASMAAESVWNIGQRAREAIPGLAELQDAIKMDADEAAAFHEAFIEGAERARRAAGALTEAVRAQTGFITAMVASADQILGGGVAPGGLHKGTALDVPALPWDPAWGAPPPGIPIQIIGGSQAAGSDRIPAINEGMVVNNFNGPVYGMDDFEDRVNQAVLSGRRRGVREG